MRKDRKNEKEREGSALMEERHLVYVPLVLQASVQEVEVVAPSFEGYRVLGIVVQLRQSVKRVYVHVCVCVCVCVCLSLRDPRIWCCVI